jgi:hypothetical protein
MRAGSAVALPAVPRRMLTLVWLEALGEDCEACTVDGAVVKRDAEPRVEALKVPIPCMHATSTTA